MRLLLVIFSITGLTAHAYQEILLTECNRYPAFNKAAIRYLNKGPSLYGSWYYELIYRRERTVILQGVCENPVLRSVIQKERFEIPENFGKPADLERDVKSYLASHSIEACPSSF